jgi:hypothetical protein
MVSLSVLVRWMQIGEEVPQGRRQLLSRLRCNASPSQGHDGDVLVATPPEQRIHDASMT